MIEAARLPGLRPPRLLRGAFPLLRGVLLPVLLLLHLPTAYPARELPLAAVLTAALAVPLLWRRRAPRAVFAAVAAAAAVQWLAGLQLPADVALLVALYTVAAETGRRGALLAGAVVAAGAVLACLRWAADGAFVTLLVAATASTVAAAVLGVNAWTTRAHLVTLRERAAELERDQRARARLAVAEERARITREMHDIVTHNLSVMVALTDAAVQVGHRAPGRADAALRQIAETGRQALTDMRRVLGVLRADEPDAARHPLPGIAQLDALAEQLTAAGLPTRLAVRGGFGHVPATAQLTVHRLVQEALTNTLKHAPAGTRAEVRVDCSAEAVALRVTDRGPRPPVPAAAPSGGHGLAGMRERAAAHGGTLRAGPLPGGGWEVRTELLLGAADPAGPA
ncbi:sensor histidine kinase [Kitasatospora sp. NPDC088134]|uniref:sensor histidine kinase n=1 Tax=Kitasatospora sp. NPDC088134 TaxID=3364071 RepID=UPI0037F62DAC